MWFKNGLKAQKPLAQGIALGIIVIIAKRPVRAKALKLQGQFVKLLPLQGVLLIAFIPRALPWAKSFCPFRACCLLELLTLQGMLLIRALTLQSVWGKHAEVL